MTEGIIVEDQLSGPGLDRLLSEANPHSSAPDPRVVSALFAVNDNARLLADAGAASATKRRWKAPVTLSVLGLLVIGVVGGGASMRFLSPRDGDVVIPITYVTDTGREVSCIYAIQPSASVESDGVTQQTGELTTAREWLQDHEWPADIGQRAYERALTNPPALIGEESLPQHEIDRGKIRRSIAVTIDEEWPEEFRSIQGFGSTSTSDCSWELH